MTQSEKLRAKAEAYREIADMIEQGWRLDSDQLWKPKQNEVWVDWLRSRSDRIRREVVGR